MKAFAELYVSLDETTKTNEKIALTRYLSAVPVVSFPARSAQPRSRVPEADA